MKKSNDQLAKKLTAFDSMDALINAAGGYFPSLNVASKDGKTLADHYDFIQQALGDPRRVARYSIRMRNYELERRELASGAFPTRKYAPPSAL